MSRGLDHIVHAVRDLDAAADFYRRLGFFVGARNRHPWGTHNHLIQFPGFFIELLTLAEPDKLGDDGFSRLFGAYAHDFAARHEGLALLMLESTDARTDAAAFRQAGIAASESISFEREGKRPDGSTVKVGFSLAFAEDRRAPDIHFATCQQHYPENFWKPAFQKHANGVQGVAGVVLVANTPQNHRDFLLAFTGASGARYEGEGFTIDLPRGQIVVMAPEAFAEHFGVPSPDLDHGARLAALRLATENPKALPALLEKAGIAATERDHGLVIGPHAALGAVLVFEPAR